MPHPVVAVVGRPNVGKSTLFNRLVGQRLAIVEDIPGVTRDRLYADVNWAGQTFTLADTGGIDPGSSDPLWSQMRGQAQTAIEDADALLFVVDTRAGITADDRDVADLIRRAGKPVLLVANKTDTRSLEADAADFYELGMGAPLTVSGTNMLGLGDLLDATVAMLPPLEAEALDEPDERPIRVAVVGKPNAGKSSLVNRLLGERRVMVSDIPGTTRDAVDTPLTADGQDYVLVDTAGIRRKRAVEDDSLERYSVIRAIAAIKRCDVAVLMVDAVAGVTEQDAKIAGLAHEEGRALVICVNKWDVPEKETGTLERFQRGVRSQLSFCEYAPILFISAMTGQRADRVLPAVRDAYQSARKRVPTGVLNEFLADAAMTMQPPSAGGQRLKIKYATQQAVAPPTFVFFCNKAGLVHFSYERFLENRLRQSFGFEGTPVRLFFRETNKGKD